MAKKTLLTVNGAYRKAKKGFLTVDSTYRKVKKAYLTFGGVYRPCWSGGELTYYGTVDALSAGVTNPAATGMNGYVLFAGGKKETGTGTSGYSSIIDAYDTSLTKHAAGNLLYPFTYVSATSLNDLSFFAGGSKGSSDKTNSVTVVNTSLSSSQVSTRMASSLDDLAATTVGNHAIFGGGIPVGGGYSSMVVAYNSSLTREDMTKFAKSIGRRGATTVGNHAIFAGGIYGAVNLSYGTDIDVYDSSLTKVTTSIALTTGRGFVRGSTVGKYAIFAGGNSFSTKLDAVDVFDSSLTKIESVSSLSEARTAIGATRTSACALFIGGETADNDSAVIDAYDENLTLFNPQPLPKGRSAHGVASTEDIVFIGGGQNANSGYLSMVEVYKYV